MAKDSGWIILARSLTDSWVWEEKPFGTGQAWVDLLLLASWKDRKKPEAGEIRIIEKGSVDVSKTWLAARWGWSRQKVDRFLRLLERDDMATVETTNKGTHIRLLNWDKFQEPPKKRATKRTTKPLEISTGSGDSRATNGTTSGQRVGNEWATNGHIITKEKKDKSFLTKEKEEERAAIRETMEQASSSWRPGRKEKR